MGYAESPAVNRHNSERRDFMLGGDRVKERLSYEHVGVTCSLFDGDASGIESRLSKVKRVLNAVSGMGIQRNGLSVATCCMIFLDIVTPIALFGSELWFLDDKACALLEAFQIYAGKRVQRLFGKSPNPCAFYGPGWVRLERLIELKKLCFIRSVLALDNSECGKNLRSDR